MFGVAAEWSPLRGFKHWRKNIGSKIITNFYEKNVDGEPNYSHMAML